MKYILFGILFCGQISSFGQAPEIGNSQHVGKPALDIDAFYHWPVITYRSGLSRDGKYVYFTTEENGVFTLHIKSLSGTWHREVPGVVSAELADEDRKLVFMINHDSLALMSLGDSSMQIFDGVSSFRTFHYGKADWLLADYNKRKGVTLLNLSDNSKKNLHNVDSYTLSKDGHAMVYKTITTLNNRETEYIYWLDMSTKVEKKIWEGRLATSLIINSAGDRLAFLATDSNQRHSILLFQSVAGTTSPLLNDCSPGIDTSLQIDQLLRFTTDDKGIFFGLTPKRVAKINPAIVNVAIWSYNDAVLPGKGAPKEQHRIYQAVLWLGDRRVVQLQPVGQNTEIISYRDNDEVVVRKQLGGFAEEYTWSKGSQSSDCLVWTGSGHSQPINLMVEDMSPDNQYVIGYDASLPTKIVGYEIQTGRMIDIDGLFPVPSHITEDNFRTTKGLLLKGWLGKGHTIVVTDRFDLWEADLRSSSSAVSLTGGAGRKQKIKFDVARNDWQEQTNQFNPEETIVLSAINLKTSDAGFYSLKLTGKDVPVLMTMGPFTYELEYPNGLCRKSNDNRPYLVKRGSASESPNYFWTTDFRSYHPISDVRPESRYNWLRTELVHFATPGHQDDQGILYLPENFDPGQRYPVVMTYYEIRSQELNLFKIPLSQEGDDINIPWLVSHGYLVFVPDIHFRSPDVGHWIMNAVMGGRRYLAAQRWVDSAHIGLQGQSYGGFETNFIVTHTRCFAAAQSSSGSVDIMREFTDVWGNATHSKQNYIMNRQGRMGAMPWERPDRYIENSPIYYLDRVETPMLIVANTNDYSVNAGHGIGLFFGLRRLGKAAWLLQYDAGHGTKGRDFIDLTLRTQQFFDYYLKNARAPEWMVKGIPEEERGIDDGLELAKPGERPGNGLLLPAERQRVDSIKLRKPIDMRFP